MDAFDVYQNDLINKNKIEFQEFPEMKWFNYYTDVNLLEERERLLNQNFDNLMFKDSKVFLNQISKGCQICGQGKWSCLFITNKCNANCFYCPTAQNLDEIPGSQGLDFKTANNYAEYVKLMGFKGVSFSGGEPLLYFERTLEYLKKVKETVPDIYIWMYTNGILLDSVKMKKLADAGLDEIRFDIGATAYNLTKIKIAKGIISNITIEIPAIPEETETLIELLPQIIDVGVTNINLHQLRLTKYNAVKLLKHDYTYIPAERPIVLESEISALKIIDFARTQKLNIGINYCSFFFKFRFQKAGFRIVLAKKAGIEIKNITQNGYVRNITGNKLKYSTFSISQIANLEAIEISYKNSKYYLKEEKSSDAFMLNKIELEYFTNMITNEPLEIPTESKLFEIYKMEYIERGLRKL